LICTNGLISKTELSASYRHISLKILENFPEVLEKVSFELGQQKSQFRISMQTPVENPLMTTESFNRQFQVGEKERETVKLKITSIHIDSFLTGRKTLTRPVPPLSPWLCERGYRTRSISNLFKNPASLSIETRPSVF
jgi:hypothetical protein